MDKKEYISKLENLIYNKVKFHSPKVKEEVDYSLLDAIGIDGSYPIFIFNKGLDKIYYKAFLEAKKNAEFNLILTEKPLISNKKLQSLKRTYLLYKEETGSNLSRTLEQLNINYLSHSDFENKLSKEYFKINGKEIALNYIPYYLSKKVAGNGVITDIKCFILNGKNYILSLNNTTNNKQTLSFEFNLPLPRGYYLFTKSARFIEIENLTSKAKAYFNYNFKNANFSFSTISGLESSTFACINVSCKIELLPRASQKLYFNYGENKYCLLSPLEMNLFFEISQRKMNELFDMKVTTRDGKFDELFNLSLPRKIWEKWQNFDVDEESENNYLKMRNEIVKKEENALQISRTFKGLKEVRFYRNYGWKRVFILHNNSTYLFADRVKYFNFTYLTKEIFDKNNEIYLSFAD